MGSADYHTLVVEVAAFLREQNKTVSTAESCTGGLVAKMLTDLPGSSAYFLAGVIAYSNSAKERLLGVAGELLEGYGAVSREVAEAMALGCRSGCGSDYAVAVTGIAGPSGGTSQKPVGLVFIAVASQTGCWVEELHLDSTLSRHQIRESAACRALEMLRTNPSCEMEA